MGTAVPCASSFRLWYTTSRRVCGTQAHPGVETVSIIADGPQSARPRTTTHRVNGILCALPGVNDVGKLAVQGVPVGGCQRDGVRKPSVFRLRR